MTWETVKVAISALGANKLRSFLTMLGIIIGVAAVITMVAMGEGAQRAVQEQIEALGTNQLTVSSGYRWWRGVGAGGSTFLSLDEPRRGERRSRPDRAAGRRRRVPPPTRHVRGLQHPEHRAPRTSRSRFPEWPRPTDRRERRH